MCLIHFHFQEHPTYKLIVATNRDEFYARPTAPAHFWDGHPTILAGRDLSQQGTWLGLTVDGRFAALTNLRNPSEKKDGKQSSRGEIVTNYLKGTMSPQHFLQELLKTSDHYAGFNVIVGNPDQLYYFNNTEKKIVNISPGTHSLSNHYLNTPWPKVVKGRKKLRDYVLEEKHIHTDRLFTLLADQEQAADQHLPKTGLSLELERALSSSFIKTKEYGTRSSTVLTIDHQNEVQFVEHTFNQGDFELKKQFNFQMNK